jgi:segregation and condensation protein B
LQERELVKVVGRKEGVGRPLLYGTTDRFLIEFGLASLHDLPPLSDAPEAFLRG